MIFPSPVLPLNSRADVQPALGVLEKAFSGAIETAGEGGEVSVIVPAARLLEVGFVLRDDPSLLFDLLVAETATDWVDWFDMVYVLRSTSLRRDLVFTVQVDRDSPEVASVAPVWDAADWMEREIFDLMGIQFAGHPDLRRVLTWDEFEGHPLRKDFGLGDDSRSYDQVPPGYKKTGEE